MHKAIQIDVDVNLTAETSKKKCQSLFVSLKNTMDQLNINSDGSCSSINGFLFGFASQKELLLSKMPSDFLALYSIWKKYHEEARCIKSLYENILAVSEEYSGNWKSHGKSSKSLFDQESDDLSEEHYCIHTRSKKKHQNGIC